MKVIRQYVMEDLVGHSEVTDRCVMRWEGYNLKIPAGLKWQLNSTIKCVYKPNWFVVGSPQCQVLLYGVFASFE